ncbi:hypothetical protein DAI22_06g114100 [Oryza sativa Japonica Group]|nr:hypothetical protein DAI22_06g114100 [Oryza sativa Japonica Group]
MLHWHHALPAGSRAELRPSAQQELYIRQKIVHIRNSAATMTETREQSYARAAACYQQAWRGSRV